jgi:hypothetical protein
VIFHSDQVSVSCRICSLGINSVPGIIPRQCRAPSAWEGAASAAGTSSIEPPLSAKRFGSSLVSVCPRACVFAYLHGRRPWLAKPRRCDTSKSPTRSRRSQSAANQCQVATALCLVSLALAKGSLKRRLLAATQRFGQTGWQQSDGLNEDIFV